MSAQREARSRTPIEYRTNGRVPTALAVGRCTEVWADPDLEFGHFSAMRRYGLVRDHWGELTGLDRLELQDVLPHSSPWSADYLIEEGQTQYVLDRFARAGCTPNDIPELATEAARLVRQASRRQP